MCGIGFFINYHPTKKLDLDLVGEVFGNLQARGTDASGFYWERQEKNEMTRGVFKAPLTARQNWQETQKQEKFEMRNPPVQQMTPNEKRQFKKDKQFYLKSKLTGKERLIILHTRQKTQGTYFKWQNNHPLFSYNYVLVHNGTIWNNCKVNGYKYYGDCDSEHILANIETYGIEKGLHKVNGNMAIIFKEFTKDSLYIFRDTNPLYVSWLPKEQLLIGVSDDDYIPLSYHDFTLGDELFNPKLITQRIITDEVYKINLLKPEIVQIATIDSKATGISINNLKNTNLKDNNKHTKQLKYNAEHDFWEIQHHE